MILYMDSSAIVKQYVSEPGSAEMEKAIQQAEAIGTCMISRVEVVAAFRKALRTRVIDANEAQIAFLAFNRAWPDLVRTRITERVIQHAAALARAHGLRGYDAVQLASAAAWQQSIGRSVTLATFDLNLWQTARAVGVVVFPANLSPNGQPSGSV